MFFNLQFSFDVCILFPWQLIRVVNLKPQDKELSSSLSTAAGSHESRPESRTSDQSRRSVQMTRVPVIIETITEKSRTGCQGKQLRNM